jgi:hypothetical protein
VGAIVGLGIGLIAEAAEENKPCGDTFCLPAAPFVLLTAVPVGAGIGAGIGATIRRWVPFFCTAQTIGVRPGGMEQED